MPFHSCGTTTPTTLDRAHLHLTTLRLLVSYTVPMPNFVASMAGGSDHLPQPLFATTTDLDEPQSPITDEEFPDNQERDAREATELAYVRRNYSRVSSYRQQRSASSISLRPSTAFGRFKFAVTKFWRHQVTVTTPHDSCRDHLGKLSHLLKPRSPVLEYILLLHTIISSLAGSVSLFRNYCTFLARDLPN